MILKKEVIYDYLKEYSKSHQSKLNIIIHEISVPLNLHATIGMACFISFTKLNGGPLLFLNGGSLLVILMLLVYIRFNNLKLYVGFVLQIIVMLLVSLSMMSKYGLHYLYLMISLYLISWAAQFLGHRHEGKKPSFLGDKSFLLVGPIWVLANLYKLLKIKF